jgi:hypothetical protein
MTIIHFITAHWLALGIAALLCVGIASNPVLALTLARKYWREIGMVVLFAGGFMLGESTIRAASQAAVISAQLEQAKATQKLSDQARAKEQSDARNSAAIAQAYERGKTDGEAIGNRVAAGVRAGDIKLRKQWRGCENHLPGIAASPAEPDATTQDRANGAGDIVRAAHDADALIAALQELLRSERR